MIDTRIITFSTNPNPLCETYSTENYKLKQVETDIVYGSSVIDVIAGYNGDKPYSRFSYVETDEKDVPTEPTDELTDAVNALNVLGVE